MSQLSKVNALKIELFDILERSAAIIQETQRLEALKKDAQRLEALKQEKLKEYQAAQIAEKDSHPKDLLNP